MKKMIRLEKIANNGNPAYWEAHIKDNTVVYKWGYVGMAEQTETITFEEGKNIGRVNSTTPEEQCLLEVMKKARRKLEKNYKLISGELTEASNEYITPDYEVPLPMLAVKRKDQLNNLKKYENFYVQEKLNGNRGWINRITEKMYSRTRKEIKHLPHVIESVVLATKGMSKDLKWIDGELFATGMSFNDVQRIIRKSKNVDEKLAKRMHFHIFDIMSDKFWEERRDYLKLIKSSSAVKVVEDYLIPADELEKYHDKFVNERGAEGIIIRLPDRGYENKRSTALIKYKKFFDEEYKVIGFTCEKNNKNLLGAVTLKLDKNSDVTFNARPSMTDEDRDYIWQHKEEYIGKLATIAFQEKDKVSGIPVFGTLKGFRDESDMPNEKEEE